MDTRHFKMLHEIAKHGNLTKASEELYLSQSAVSHQLKSLESFFETQIFIRDKKKMMLTENGQLILAAGTRMLNDMENIKRQIQYRPDNDMGEIKMSTQCFTCYHWLCSFLAEFNKRYPKVYVNIISEATHKTPEFLVNGAIDIGIVTNKKNNKLNYHLLFIDELVVVVHKNHKWANFKNIDIKELPHENFIMYNLPVELSETYNTIFKNGIHPKRVYKIGLTEVIIEMVKAQIGITVMPRWILTPYIADIVGIPIGNKGLMQTWYSAVLKSKTQPAYVDDFIQGIAKHLKKY